MARIILISLNAYGTLSFPYTTFHQWNRAERSSIFPIYTGERKEMTRNNKIKITAFSADVHLQNQRNIPALPHLKKKKNHRSTMSSFQMLSNDLVDLSLLLLPQLCYPNIKRSSSEITLFHPSQTLFSSTTPGYVALLSHFSLSWKRCRLFGTPYQVAARRIKGCHFR